MMRGKKLIEKKKRYKRLKRICWTTFFVLLGIMIIAYIFMYTASQGPGAGEYFVTRTTPHTLVLTGQQVPVNLTLTPTVLTSIPPEGGRQLDIIIGLDNSLSMRNALQMVRKVASSFMQNTNLERHQVGIARLDSEARVIQGLSHNQEVMKAVIGEIPRGVGTKIHDALLDMNRELNSIRRRPGSLGVAIILSDGRSNPRLAQMEAEKLKQQEGIFIAPIGMGEHINDSLMKSMASWPSEYKSVTAGEDADQMVKDLTEIYKEWTKILEQLVAVDIHVKEYYNHTALELVNNSLRPPGTIDPDEKFIEWTIPFLTTQPVTLQYLQKTRGILWHQLDPTTGTVDWKPVGLPKTEMPIHRKPRIIVVSLLFLLLLLLLLLLALLPWFIAWWLRRQAAKGPALLPEEIKQPIPFPTPEPLPPLALDKLVRSTEPTLVIGLGGTGRWVLTFLKKAIMETNYGRLPQTVKFLLLDTYEKEISGDTAKTVQVAGVELNEDEYLILNEGSFAPEKLLERTKNMSENPGSESHLSSWWPAKAFKDLTAEAFKISNGTKKRRPIGRMALFLDLEKGTETSRFWTRISSLIKELGKGTHVFIASSLSGGMGSGMFTDVAYLTRHISQSEQVEGVTVHAVLALQNTFAPFTDALGLTIPNTFAALRELDRYLSCRDFHFPMVYSPEENNQINGALRAPLLDNCYIFDGERTPFSLHTELPERGVFPSMSDTIHTFLYNAPGGAFDQEVKQGKAVSELEREESGHGVVCSLGTFVYRLPMFEFVQTFKYRFAKETTADLFGLIKDENGEWTLSSLSAKDVDMLNRELENFLYKEGPERSPVDVLQTVAVRDMEMLPAIVEADRAFKDKHGYLNRHKMNYSRYLAEYLMDILNGNQEIIAMERQQLFNSALYMAQQLEKCFQQALNQGTGFGRDARIARELLESYHEVTESTVKQLNAYIELVIKGRKDFHDPEIKNEAGTKVHDTSPKDKFQPPLIQYLEAREIKQLESRKIDNSILVREYLYDDEMEKKLYGDYLGEKVRNQHQPRFVWHCRESDSQLEIKLKLAVDEHKTIDAAARTSHNAEIVISLPEILLQALWNIDITPYLETAYPDTEELANKLYKKSMPLIHFEQHQAVRHVLKMFLSLKQSDYLDELVKNLRPNFPSREHVKGTDFRDAHAFASVSVLDSLPLPAIRPYEQSMKNYLALPGHHRQQLHVFAAEQNAALYEEMLPEVKEPKQAFHPRFISLLEHLERVKLFAHCAVSGLIPDIFHYNVDRYYLEIPGQSGPGRIYLTQKDQIRKPTPFDALQAFIKGKSKSETGEDITIPMERIRDLLKTNSPTRESLLKTQTELTTMKGDEEIKPEVRNLLSFIHLILNEKLKELTK
ncbi:MAG: tubulin-like doman-containing protein [Candidatus Aminicenantes bacterium]|jgi:hypothetical protein